jgi:hypothetical protein
MHQNNLYCTCIAPNYITVNYGFVKSIEYKYCTNCKKEKGEFSIPNECLISKTFFEFCEGFNVKYSMELPADNLSECLIQSFVVSNEFLCEEQYSNDGKLLSKLLDNMPGAIGYHNYTIKVVPDFATDDNDVTIYAYAF